MKICSDSLKVFNVLMQCLMINLARSITDFREFFEIYHIAVVCLKLSGFVSWSLYLLYLFCCSLCPFFFIYVIGTMFHCLPFYLQVQMRGIKGINAQEIPIKFYGKPYFL